MEKTIISNIKCSMVYKDSGLPVDLFDIVDNEEWAKHLFQYAYQLDDLYISFNGRLIILDEFGHSVDVPKLGNYIITLTINEQEFEMEW